MLLISLVNGILVDCVSNLLIAQSTIHYRSILLLTTTILLCPSESISPVGIGFCFVVLAQLSNPLRVLSKTQPGWIMNIPAVGLIGSPPIILAMNYWPLVIGYRLEVWGFADICASTLYAL